MDADVWTRHSGRRMGASVGAAKIRRDSDAGQSIVAAVVPLDARKGGAGQGASHDGCKAGGAWLLRSARRVSDILAGVDGDGWFGVVDGLRQRGQPAAGARGGTAA